MYGIMTKKEQYTWIGKNNFIIAMLSLRKQFQQSKKVSDTTPSLRSFNVDEFIELIMKKQEGQTTWKENRYIRRQVEQNPKAAQAWQDAKDTLPHERFSLRAYHPPLIKVAVIFLAVTLIAASVYALRRYYSISVSVHIDKKQTYDGRFSNKRLAEIAAMIEDNYSRKVVFDRKEIAATLLSGRMDTTMQVDEFLEELRQIGVDNYIDDKGLIHIR